MGKTYKLNNQGEHLKKILTTLAVCITAIMLLHAKDNSIDQDIVNNYYKQLTYLSKDQLKVMLYSYNAGKEFDLGFSLAAIAWKESNFGQYLMNLSDGSSGAFGVYQILLEYAAARNKIKSNWDKSRYAERLMLDIELCANEAIAELIFWRKYHAKHSNSWRRMLASYNAGTNGINTVAGKMYSDDAVHRVRALEMYFRKHGLHKKLDK